MPNNFGGLYCFANTSPQANVLTETQLQHFTHAAPSFGVTPDIGTSTLQVDLSGFYIVTTCITITVDKNKVLLRAVITHNGEPTNFVCVNEFDIQEPNILMIIAPIRFGAGDTCSLRVSASKEVDMILLTGQLVIQRQDLRETLILD